MSDLPTPRPMARVIAALLDAERHSVGLAETLATARAALLDALKEGDRWEKPLER